MSCLEALGIPFEHSSTMVIGGMGTQKSQTWNLLSILRVKDFYIHLSYIYSRLVTTKPNCFLSVKCSWVKVFTKYVLYVICFNSFMWPTTGTMLTSKPLRCQYLFEVSFCLLQICLAGTQFWVCLQFKTQRQPVPRSLWNPWMYFTAMLLLMSSHGTTSFLLRGITFSSAINFNKCYIHKPQARWAS